MSDSSSQLVTRRLERTSTPGIFKRGKRYVVRYRDLAGKDRKRAARTLVEARRLKASLSTDVARGEYRTVSDVRFSDYWPQWIDSYSGRTARGFRENTRAEYRRDLEREAAPYFGRMRLTEIEPQHIKRWLSGLAARGLAQSTVRSIFAPVRAMLADAAEEGTIRHNPAAGVRIPSTAKRTEPKRKSLTDDEVERLRAELTSDEDRLLVDFLLVTGLRISEAIALDISNLDFGKCRVKVTKRFYRGFDAPKSSFGRREVPITPDLARRLWPMRKDRPHVTEGDPLFVSPEGARLDYANVYNRVLKPAMRRAGITWGGAHRLRHTTATHLIRQGASANQAQLWLGHHDPGFTARTYVHLDTNDLPDPAIFDSYFEGTSGHSGATLPADMGRTAQLREAAG
jgi:integrase